MPPPVPPDAARAAGLRWVSDAAPGLRRVARGERVAIVDARGRAVRDDAVLARVRRLAIPPAWREVWICADADGHLQATGVDARGRKQYRYHPDWAATRGQTKFARLRTVAAALPAVRRRVERALAGDATPTRERVLATLVKLLDATWLRIGNPEYARTNRSYGLSTLKVRHAALQGDTVKLSFTGKAGVRHEVALNDRRVARVVRRCRELPGQELFQWVDDAGAVHRIGSADVNAWLAEAAGTPLTAKDFRTWHGTVQALDLALAACADGAPPSRPAALVAEVARRLGNTPAVCRKAYIHPEVLALFEAAADADRRAGLRAQRWVLRPPPVRGLRLAERRLLGLLRSIARGAGTGTAAQRAPDPEVP
jgi:DNA topoisomerase-1